MGFAGLALSTMLAEDGYAAQTAAMPLALVGAADGTGGAAVDKAPSPTTVPDALVGAALGAGGAAGDKAPSPT
ncbi:MAG: hypothetical protein CMJ59_04155, partial [Planctomycetaceae bacterium]|nr:hypothetical protein [Planctomycetaceae bacterium]